LYSSSTTNFPWLSPTENWLIPEPKSESHCDWWPVSKSWCRAPSGAHDQIFITLWQVRSFSMGRLL
jgi:hypothetical protein